MSRFSREPNPYVIVARKRDEEMAERARARAEAPVHAIAYASQPDIQFACDGSWSTPGWPPETGIPGVSVADDGRHYTFADESVTCPACIARRKT